MTRPHGWLINDLPAHLEVINDGRIYFCERCARRVAKLNQGFWCVVHQHIMTAAIKD